MDLTLGIKYNKRMNTVGADLKAAIVFRRPMDSRGFTIVELLIVIVVIAILAAITIVAYNGIQNRANDSTVSSDFSGMAKKIALYQADNGQYPLTSEMSTLGIRVAKGSYDVSSNALVYCISSDRMAYAVIGRSKSKAAWYVSSSTGGATQTFANAFPVGGATVCPQAGVSSPTWLWLHDSATGSWVSWL